MEIKVEGGDEYSRESYKRICRDMLRDVGVRGSIEHVYLYCNPTEYIFIISVKIGEVQKPVRVKDVTERGKDKLKITNEKFAPELLALLWEKYGERVWQIGRLEIGLKLILEEIETLDDLIVYDYREDLISRILDGIDRILPEGARIKHLIPSTDSITIISAEDPIEESWKEKAMEIVGELEV